MNFVFTSLPYMTLTAFFLGLVWRIWRFFKSGVQSYPLFPVASQSSFQKLKTYLSQILLFTPLFRNDRRLWALSWMFHLSLFLIIAGHFRMFLGIRIDERVAFTLGSFFGTVFLISVAILLLRRFGEVRIISTAEDYLALILLVLIALSGLAMRFSGSHYDLSDYAYSIATLSPEVPDYDTFLLIHAFLAQILIAYLPYGKLFHSIGSFVTSYQPLRWQNG